MAHHGDDAREDGRRQQKANGGFFYWRRRRRRLPPRRGPGADQKTRERVAYAPKEAAKHDASLQCDADHSSPLVSDVSREGGCRRHCRCSLRSWGSAGRAAKFCDPGTGTDRLAARRISVFRYICISRPSKKYCRHRQEKEEAYVCFRGLE
jgi:hypothetical protein